MTQNLDKTEIDVERQVKKAAIGWAVPAILGLVCVAMVALGRVQVNAMLVDYQTKEQASQQTKEFETKLSGYAQQVTDLRDQVSELKTTLNSMDKKLDHLQFILDYSGDHRALSPKQKATTP